MVKLLFIEDDELCAYAIQGGLEVIGDYEIRWVPNGKEALQMYEAFRPEVVVSDIEMPGMDGLKLVRTIRAMDSQVVILLASGKVSPKSVTEGYAAGIDEYVKKPYIAEELHPRIQAILRRSRRAKSSSSPLESNTHIHIGRYRLDTDTNQLTLVDQEIQKLTQREADLLLLLLEHQNKLVERKEILKRFWEGDDSEFSSRSLDVFISKLRKYLSHDPTIQIVNERGRGLRLKIE